MKNLYKFGILRTDDSPEADKYNNRLLGVNVLGIEVIKSALAERCGLGNIDPQHSGEFKSSAIEAALDWPLPPQGATLVTVRPDRDSLGAMAVLSLRAKGKKVNVKLVACVGLMDLVGGRRAVESNQEFIKYWRIETSALQVVIIDPFGVWPSIEEKIEEFERIIGGEITGEQIYNILVVKKLAAREFNAEAHGGLVFIKAPGKYAQARDWGNRKYPVVLVFDPEFKMPGDDRTYARWSLVRQEGFFDRLRFLETINVEEALARNMTPEELEKRGYSWGGPRNIVSSPMGRETTLAKEAIIRIARECAESGRVS